MGKLQTIPRILASNSLKGAILLVLLSGVAFSSLRIPDIEFSYDFEQFFPQGDEDYTFFREFIEEFETDDNFLLIGLPHAPSIYDSVFLSKVAALTDSCSTLPHVTQSLSLTNFILPLKTPFGMTAIPAFQWQNPATYSRDSLNLTRDKRIYGRLLDKESTSLLLFLKTTDNLQLDESEELLKKLNHYLEVIDIDTFHLLGRANFQVELVRMQKEEVIRTAIFAAVLVSLLLFLIYRNLIVVGLALLSILLSFLLFFGYLSTTGKDLNAMASLYPIILIIVGSSDVIHLFSKYIGELNGGRDRYEALANTIKEIGLATFLTSVTTGIGFISLSTSKIEALRDFGFNSAVGVLMAFFIIMLFMILVMPMLPSGMFKGAQANFNRWEPLLSRWYLFGRKKSGLILKGSLVLLVLAIWGLTRVSTNYSIEENMPRGAKVTQDFVFFDEHYQGFRPFEIAFFAKDGRMDTYTHLSELDKTEKFLEDSIGLVGVQSAALFYKSLNQAFNNNSPDYFRFPDDENIFDTYTPYIRRFERVQPNVLLNRQGDKARISAQLKDVGVDSILRMQARIDSWLNRNMDTTAIAFRQTGTGIMIDKNAEYVRQDLLYGLGLAIGIVGLLMVFLFRNLKLWVIALVPNLIPLILSAAILGFLNVELEASISIAFAVIFGIAVDDSIHFLTKFRLVYGRTRNLEFAVLRTFKETGKAIVLTTIILFFGFLTLLTSTHPPSQTIGVLIGITLISAMLADLFILPILLRKFLKKRVDHG